MAAIPKTLFCPKCYSQALTTYPIEQEVSCEECNLTWDKVQLNELCCQIENRADNKAFFQRHVESSLILDKYIKRHYSCPRGGE